VSRFLLDTHAFLWFIMGDPSLAETARRVIEASDTQKVISLVSLWEIGIKHRLGKLPLSRPFHELMPEQIQLNGFGVLPLELAHINLTLDLPLHHRDPFDRLLIAQAFSEKLTIIGKDRFFEAYGVPMIWL
jgi:PIN domain nuclease of toxin-antitoxin system